MKKIIIALYFIALTTLFVACHQVYAIRVEVRDPYQGEAFIDELNQTSAEGQDGTSFNLFAYPCDGYLFAGWYFEETLLSTEDVYTFVLPKKNVVIFGEFTILDQPPTVLDHLLNLMDYKLSLAENMNGMPSIGTYHLPILFVEFPDQELPDGTIENIGHTFNGTSAETGWESVSSYYTKASYGLLNLTFDLYSSFVAPLPSTSYVDVEDNGEALMNQAMAYYQDEVDFTLYDFDQNNAIDSVIFIYGNHYDIEVQTPWWAYVSVDGSQDAPLHAYDGLWFRYYMWASYAFWDETLEGMIPTQYNAATYIHETGHLLGLPDYYSDYNYLGGFDMMDMLAGDFCPYNKTLLGWIKPLLIQPGTTTLTLSAYSPSGQTIMIPNPSYEFNPNSPFQEYLLLSYYTLDGLNNQGIKYLPTESGLAIYHVSAWVDEDPYDWSYLWTNNKYEFGSQLLRLLEADQDHSIGGEIMVENSDLLQSGTVDLSETYTWSNKQTLYVRITVVSRTDSTITITISC